MRWAVEELLCAISEDDLRHRYSELLKKITDSLGEGWQISDRTTGGLTWRTFICENTLIPTQGWKIHISAAAIEALALLETILPLLAEKQACFKLPSTVDGISAINFGEAGDLQVGKIITVYSRSAEEVAILATEVDRVWPNSKGPVVPNEITLRKDGAVSLRYGAFGHGEIITDPIGRPIYALRLPDGTLIRDDRTLNPAKSDWAADMPLQPIPSEQIDIMEELVVAGRRYLPFALLYDGPISKVILGLDIASCETVVMKVVQRGLGGDLRGFDARTRLFNEFAVLNALSQLDKIGLRPVGISNDDPAVLVTEDMGGVSLDKLSRPEQVKSLILLARVVAKLHDAGFAHRDIKLSNALLLKDEVKLIDFGLAARLGTKLAPLGGTGGYVPPEGSTGQVTTAGDMYALGASIAHVMLLCDPASLPRGGGRLVGLLQLIGAHHGAYIVKRLLSPTPDKRPSASDTAALLEEHFKELDQETEPESETNLQPVVSMNWCKRAAWEAALATRHFFQKAEGGGWWQNFHFLSDYACEGVNLGVSGIILGLASIDEALGRSSFNEDISAGADWLNSREPVAGSAGLFTGNAGVALALGVVAGRLERSDLIEASRSRLIAAASPSEEFDLFCGAAGVVTVGCILSEILGQDWPLEIVRDKAQALLDAATIRQGVVVWPASKALGASDAPYTGAAHGSAGIAMALAMWSSHARDNRSTNLAIDTFRSLYSGARVEDGTTFYTRLGEDLNPAPIGSWCHGVAGYLWCILQAFGGDTAVGEEVDWAASIFTKATTTAVDNPTYCHGLSGLLELWRMLAELPCYRKQAQYRTARIAAALRFLHQRIEGKSVWCSDDPRIITPDLWVGFLAPATALALYATGTQESILSPRWLRKCAGQTS